MPAVLRVAVASLLATAAFGQSTDGGRSDLPGMKKDIFDEIKGSKRGGGPKNKVKERAECPKSDGLSPFSAMYIDKDDIFVKFAGAEEKCAKLHNIGGANISSLWAASKTCGSVGEWKRRVAEELSAIFFVGGYESWPGSENQTIDIETEFGNYSVPVLESNYETIKGCWARGCKCEQANSPVLRAVLCGALILCLLGIGNDAAKVTWDKIRGKSDDDSKEKKDKKEKKEKKERKSKVEGSDSEASEKKEKKDRKSKVEGSDSEASEKKEKKDKKEKKERKSRKEASEDGSDSERKSGKDESGASGKEDGSEKSRDDDGKEDKGVQ